MVTSRRTSVVVVVVVTGAGCSTTQLARNSADRIKINKVDFIVLPPLINSFHWPISALFGGGPGLTASEVLADNQSGGLPAFAFGVASRRTPRHGKSVHRRTRRKRGQRALNHGHPATAGECDDASPLWIRTGWSFLPGQPLWFALLASMAKIGFPAMLE